MTHFSASNLLTDCRQIALALQSAGFPHDDAFDKASLFASAAARLPHTDNPLALFVPGRLELLGKHTDYAGGRSIVAAVERGFCVVAAPRADVPTMSSTSPTPPPATQPPSPSAPTSPPPPAIGPTTPRPSPAASPATSQAPSTASTSSSPPTSPPPPA
ncbi:MAG: galactokinase family protein [Planctomycetota bacterium]|nr:galactokinase family protein [Planctomycetota bacterium]